MPSLSFLQPPVNKTLALVVSLLSATATLSIALSETITFSGLVHSSHNDGHSAARTISLWWKHTLHKHLVLNGVLGVASLISGTHAIKNRFADSNGSTGGQFAAIAGTMFAVVGPLSGTVPPVSRVAGEIAEAYDGLDGLDAVEENRAEVVDDLVIDGQRQLLRLWLWRLLGMDVPAVLCFAWLNFGR